MYVNNSKKLIFVHIPKTGGTSVAVNLGSRDADSDWPHIYSLHPEILTEVSGDEGSNNAHPNPHYLRSYPEYDEYETVSVARNPWAKNLSIFMFWLNQHRKIMEDTLDYNGFPGQKLFKPRIKSWAKTWHPLMIREGFEGWCRRDHNHILSIGPCTAWEDTERAAKHHWFKLETDMEQLADFLDIEPIGVHNTSQHLHYTEYYTDETAELIRERYIDDIRRFGYVYGE